MQAFEGGRPYIRRQILLQIILPLPGFKPASSCTRCMPVCNRPRPTPICQPFFATHEKRCYQCYFSHIYYCTSTLSASVTRIKDYIWRTAVAKSRDAVYTEVWKFYTVRHKKLHHFIFAISLSNQAIC